LPRCFAKKIVFYRKTVFKNAFTAVFKTRTAVFSFLKKKED